MCWGALTTKAPASMAMWRIDAIQPSLSSAVGATQICGPPWYTRQRASGMRFSQQMSPPTRPMPGKVGDPEVVAGSDAVEHALVHGRHQLAVAVQQPLGAEQQQGVVERAGRSSSRSFTPMARWTPRSAHAFTSRSTSGPSTSRLESHIRSHRSSASLDPGRRRGRPDTARVERHEALGEHRERRTAVRGLCEQLDRLVDRGLGIEDHGRGLHGRHSNRSELRHGSTVPLTSAGEPGPALGGIEVLLQPLPRLGDVGRVGVRASEHAEVATDLGEVPPEAVQVDGGR